MSTVIFGTLKSEYLPPQLGCSGRSDAMIPQRGSVPTEQEHGVQQRKITNYDELPLLLSVKQLVDLMGVSDSSIYELIQEDDFPSLRIGKRIVVPKEELRKWITAHTKGASGC